MKKNDTLFSLFIIFAPYICIAGMWYVDPNGDNSDGTTWATAWTALDSASSNSTQGDTTYFRDTLTVDQNWTADGSDSAINYVIGVAQDCTETVGEMAVIDLGGGGLICLTQNGDWTIFRNILFTNASAHGTNANWAGTVEFHNCAWVGNGGVGLRLANDHVHLRQCLIENNTAEGIYKPGNYSIAEYTLIRNNGGEGVYVSGGYFEAYGCVLYKNTDYEINAEHYGHKFINSVMDRGTVGYYVSAATNITIINSRITNMEDVAIDGVNSGISVTGSFFDNNANGNYGNNISLIYDIDNVYTGTQGYADTSIGDYSTNTTATARRFLAGVPYDTTSRFYATAGLPAPDTACSGSDTVEIHDTLYIRQGGRRTPYQGGAYR